MKKAFKVLLFALLFMLVYGTVNGVLETKTTDGNGRMVIYKALPEDTVDVLMIGSSHVGMNVDTSVLWNDYGIAGYTLWSGMQPVVDSYYFLKEGLKQQSPKVAVVEVFLAAFTTEDYEYSTVMKSIQALPFGLDKIKAALASAATWQQAAEMVWGMPVYHERYDELTKEDFTFAENAQKTSLKEINATVISQQQVQYPVTMLDYSTIEDALPLTALNEEYLLKIIELCRVKNVQLVFLVSPFEATEEEAMRLHSVELLAEENGVACVNYLRDFALTGIDPANDFSDIGHLNSIGIQKYSEVFGSYLAEHFDLPDRRQDENHLWNQETTSAEEGAVFALEKQFQGDGVTRFTDTGVKLYENKFDSWTMLTRLDTKTFGDDEVYLSCFSEDPTPGNYGLLIRKKSEGRISVKLGDNIEVEAVYDTSAETVDLAVLKDVQSYTVYLNGTAVTSDYELPCEAYAGTLLIGCQELSAGGEKFRYSRTHVLNLEVYDRLLTQADVLGWSPEALPMPELPMGQEEGTTLRWALPTQFVGDGAAYKQPRYYDSGVALYEEAATRFTLAAEMVPGLTEDGNVFFSCFAEEASNYRGLLLRQTEPNVLDLLIGSAYALRIPCTDGTPLRLTVTKDVSVYNVYVDGQAIASDMTLTCAPYGGTLLVGCEELTAGGEKFRMSSSPVLALEVYSGIREDAAELVCAPVPLPEERQATSVNYTLPYAFAGNGVDRYEDTGVRLYDLPTKDWTLDTVLSVHANTADGVFMSCFSEEVGAYRGFMIRQAEANQLTLFAGNAATITIPFDVTAKQLHIVVSKQGDSTTVCVNGALLGVIESGCDAYDGTLLIGAQIDAEGALFRFSSASVDSLTVTDGALSEEEAMERSKLEEKTSRF